MTKALIGWENRVKTGTLSAGSAVTTAPVTNLQSDQGARAWQTAGVRTSAVGAYFDIDAGSSVTWRAFGVFRTNLGATATVRITLGSSVGASGIYDSGALSGLVAGYGQLVHDAGQNYSARHCRIWLDDAANPDGFIRVGLAFAGPVFSPATSVAFEAERGRMSEATEVVTKGGQEFVAQDWARRGWDFALEDLTEAEAAEMFDLDRIARLGGNVLFIPRPSGSYVQREAVFGRLHTVDPQRAREPDRWAWAARITERL